MKNENYPKSSEFEKISENVLEIKKQVWTNDTAPTPITCRVRYLFDEGRYYVFFYNDGNWGNNCDTFSNEKNALDDFYYRLKKYKNKSTIPYNLKRSIKMSKIS